MLINPIFSIRDSKVNAIGTLIYYFCDTDTFKPYMIVINRVDLNDILRAFKVQFSYLLVVNQEWLLNISNADPCIIRSWSRPTFV